ncbi:DUF4446 family protein [Clostridium hydrogeniformans]|uniref:DUF4446 family protein n=1 Tax=Clostridium hydrogeniformans TaxID=349933 RepID=UPI00048020FE|nr:DUF4446 family protein [Clostridium hydrogeniformans]
MENIVEMIKDFSPYIIIGLSVIVILLLILVILIFNSLGKLETKYRRLMRGTNNNNLEESIIAYLDKVDNASDIVNECNKRIEDINSKVKGCLQKVSVVRYKAFEDVGSDLSFSIALLNGNNDGVILTGIFGRNESTCYAKPIDKGISRYDLSDEEQQVLNEAINK